MILLLVFIFILNSALSINFLNIQLDILVFNILLVYYLTRLALAVNLFQLVGYSALVLVTFSGILFWLQFDVFACFLLVAESIVLLFVLSILMHLNYTNSSKFTSTLLLIPVTCVVLCIPLNYNQSFFNYWVDWYAVQTSQFNDLLPQYLYFYTIDGYITILTGLWLLFLTFLIVNLILGFGLSKKTSETSISYFRKTQNIWTQWYKKPVIKFFNK